MEQSGALCGFIELCDLGAQMGWHERNGGNASYRMTAWEVEEMRPSFSPVAERGSCAWRPLDIAVPSLAGEFFLVTGTGRFMRHVRRAPEQCVGVVQIDSAGERYRIAWGLQDAQGAVGACAPTSEFAGHLLLHAARKRATNGAARVAYHCHPTDVVALSAALPLNERDVTRALWKAHTECIIMFPEGVGVVPCEVPGSMELARQTERCMAEYPAALWAHHGLFVTGETFDDAFGLAEVIVKAAAIYRSACAMNGGPDFAQTIGDDDLRSIAEAWGITPNKAFL